MKVTEEMVERAKRARVHTLAMAWEKAERIVLEAALADVPEPEDVRREVLNELAYGRSVERQMLDARIAELETKLGKVDACEVCGDVLMPQSPRCKRHVHTEPGDDEWEKYAEEEP